MKPACGNLVRCPDCKSSKGDGIPKILRGRDAVLPGPAGFSTHQVRGSRLQIDSEGGSAPSFCRWILSKTHSSDSQERHARNHFKIRYVPMPAQRRSGRIFRDDGMIEIARCQLCPGSNACTQFKKKRRNSFSFHQYIARKIVTSPIAQDPAARSELLISRGT